METKLEFINKKSVCLDCLVPKGMPVKQQLQRMWGERSSVVVERDTKGGGQGVCVLISCGGLSGAFWAQESLQENHPIHVHF